MTQPTRIQEIANPTYRSKVAERIARRSVADDGDRLRWLGVVDRWGYGQIRLRFDGVNVHTGAHRAAWLAMRGEIPGDMVIDHLCRNRSCVNVDHMELVSNAENCRRADHSNKKGRSGVRRGSPLHSCGKHGRSDGYEHVTPNGYVRWVCRICAKANRDRHRARKAA